MFGYPVINYNKNIEGYDRITYLWNQIAKPILSKYTKRWILKDLIDSYNNSEKVDKYVLSSFASGKPVSMKTISKLSNPNSTLKIEEIDPLYKYRKDYNSI